MLSGFFQAISSEISTKKIMTNAAISCFGKTRDIQEKVNALHTKEAWHSTPCPLNKYRCHKEYFNTTVSKNASIDLIWKKKNLEYKPKLRKSTCCVEVKCDSGYEEERIRYENTSFPSCVMCRRWNCTTFLDAHGNCVCCWTLYIHGVSLCKSLSLFLLFFK